MNFLKKASCIASWDAFGSTRNSTLDTPRFQSYQTMAAKAPKKVTIIIIGDGTVGKTSILVRYAEQKFDQNDYNPTVLTKTSVNQHFEGKEYQLELIDTAGQEGFNQTSTQHYRSADVFLICYSVDNKKSFKNVTRKVSKLHALNGQVAKAV